MNTCIFDTHCNLTEGGLYLYLGRNDDGLDMFYDFNSNDDKNTVLSKLDDRERFFVKRGDHYSVIKINRFENGSKHIILEQLNNLIKTYCLDNGDYYIFDKQLIEGIGIYKAQGSFTVRIGENNDKEFDIRSKYEFDEADFLRMLKGVGFDSEALDDKLVDDLMSDFINGKVNLNFNNNGNGKEDTKNDK
jgi:hypothetical protein